MGTLKGVDKLLAYVAIIPIAFYKRVVSPWLAPACRFHPTCSEYSREAYLQHGFIKGSALTVSRLLRCNPWCEGGHDPVPKRGEP